MPVQTIKSITKKIPGGLAVESQSRKFRIIVDEPKNMGGLDTGMTPMEILLASLGSCLTIVAYSFAASKDIKIEDMWVEVEGDMDLAGFMHGEPGVRPGFQTIRPTMHIRSDAPAEKIQEFQKFVESRCPITDTVLHGTRLLFNKVVIEK